MCMRMYAHVHAHVAHVHVHAHAHAHVHAHVACHVHVVHVHVHMLIKSQVAGCAKRGLFVTFPTKGPHNRLFQRSKVLQHHTVQP